MLQNMQQSELTISQENAGLIFFASVHKQGKADVKTHFMAVVEMRK